MAKKAPIAKKAVPKAKPKAKAKSTVKAKPAAKVAAAKAPKGGKSLSKPAGSQSVGGAKKGVTSKTVAKKPMAKNKKAVAKKAMAPTASRSSKVKARKLPTKATAGKSTTASKVVAKKLSGKPAKPRVEPASKKARLAPDYSEFKSLLLEKRRRLFGDVAMMSEEALGSEDGAVDNHAPIHPAEVGSHSFEQEFTLGLLSRDGDKIRLVDMALEKIAEGSYGLCDECGGRIPKGRLELLPESIFCVKCASKLEGSAF